MRPNQFKRDLQKQIRAIEKELQKLIECKEYMINSFEVGTPERYAVYDIFTQVIDRKKKQISQIVVQIFLSCILLEPPQAHRDHK